MNKKPIKFILLAIIVFVCVNFLMNSYYYLTDPKEIKTIAYSEFQNKIAANEFQEVTIIEKLNTQMKMLAESKNNPDVQFVTNLPNRDSIFADTIALMNKEGVDFKFTDKEEGSLFASFIFSLIPLLIICGIIIWMMKGSKGGQGGLMKMFKHKAQMIHSNVKFSDVAGNEETIMEVKEIVDFLAKPEKYQELGGHIPKGVLMIGPPGTGKTLLAKAVAGEAKVPFFTAAGSDFVEVFAGLGAGRIRGMFEEAKANAPCIIFIDEIDALGKSRNSGMGGGNDEREQALNQLLVEMDGVISSDAPIIIMGATNRVDILDKALVRPGRFDRIVTVPLPDVISREKILKIHARKIKMSKSVRLDQIAKSTVGFSGADLANLCNEAALTAGRSGSRSVEKLHFDEAMDKILMGVKQQGIQMEDKDKSFTAYHEAGHAIIGWVKYKEGLHDPVHKVSIIPRGRALGVTVYQPEKDRVSLSKEEIHAQISSLFGGRIAEELTGGLEKITTGASNDIDRATNYAYNYVTKWGMSEMGPIYLASHESHIDGREQIISEKTANEIQACVKKLLDDCLKDGTDILAANKDKLQMMHDALMELETIDSDVVDSIMMGTFDLQEYIATVVKREHELLEEEMREREAEIAVQPVVEPEEKPV
jgi:cell division protease FtsH